MTDPYTVEFSRQASSYYRRLPRESQQRVSGSLRRNAAAPHDRQLFTELHGALAGYRRARVGNLRIIFSIDDLIRVVAVTQPGPRGDIYGQ
ncbi:MAG: type II toxin-antitoxin system RelE/ParE family toxin [Dehalococcoidia bacterium]